MVHSDSTANLYIVATPIGNLGDISQRAIDTLKTVDLILAEDTRHSQKLLKLLGISNRLASLHAYNESNKSEDFIKLIQNGQNIALVSDAGTPLISDPGYPLVRLAREKGIPVIPIPGACAITAALCASGLPCDKFRFDGFLPAKPHARREQLQVIAHHEITTVIYESTHRIIECLQDIHAIFSKERRLVLAKELTKKFETIISGSATELLSWLQKDPARKSGEFVLIIEANQQKPEQETETLRILKLLLQDLPLKQAVKLTAAITGEKKNTLYQKALTL